ncbi:hypothetical protein D8674_035518 [Pyrus ussuriensis x Pyrus communis]|uniref:Uncharacterized protein n=1 Tax=Pyrus ussuriensis x Pyrus communis TaxID=2448454 RepID=A0A5N5GI21_9ROSA|nr:hypothetical protein D8674_035518 [Pyrus ussuriensis x Pyrus communis]
MFCIAINYICMHILGEGPNGGQDNACARDRKWILDHGSVTHIPSWGNWLSMEDKNKDQSVPAINPNDLRQHFEFAHAIDVAMRNNCHTTEWRSWKDVPKNVKKVCKYTLDNDTNEQFMKLMEDPLEGGYNRWRYEVLRNGLGPSK